MNLKILAIEGLRAMKPHTVSVRRAKSGKLYAIWRPKLPAGAVTLVWDDWGGPTSSMLTVTFHRRIVLKAPGPIVTYPGLTLVTGFKLPRRSKR